MTTTHDTRPLLKVRQLEKVFTIGGLLSTSKVRALGGVDLDIAPGEIVALVGESGSGKSTLARCLTRLEQPTSGTFEFDGVDILKTEPRSASRKFRSAVQMIFQDPFGSLNPAHRVGHFLERPLLLHKMASRKDLERVKQELMERVDLPPELLNRYPHELSGGQRQRVAIARALAVQPRLILADEPTSMLDVSVRIGVLNLMRRLCKEQGISMLYITHDLASARYLADRIVVMFAGEFVEGGEALELIAKPAHQYTQLLISAVPDPERTTPFDPVERARMRQAVIDPTSCNWANDACSRDKAVFHQMSDDPEHWVRCGLYSPSSTAPGTAIHAAAAEPTARETQRKNPQAS